MFDLAISTSSLVLAFAVVVFGAFAQGVAGFGLALVIGPLLTIISPVFLPGPVVLLVGVMTATMVVKERKSISVISVKRSIGGYLLGTIVAAAVISSLPQRETAFLFAALILITVAMGILGKSIPNTPKVLFTAGTVGGFMGTLSGVGLPPLALALQNESGPTLRGTLACVGFISITMAQIALAYVGKIGWLELKLALFLAPAVLIGVGISIPAAALCDKGYTKPAIFLVAALSALMLIAKNI